MESGAKGRKSTTRLERKERSAGKVTLTWTLITLRSQPSPPFAFASACSRFEDETACRRSSCAARTSASSFSWPLPSFSRHPSGSSRRVRYSRLPLPS